MEPSLRRERHRQPVRHTRVEAALPCSTRSPAVREFSSVPRGTRPLSYMNFAERRPEGRLSWDVA